MTFASAARILTTFIVTLTLTTSVARAQSGNELFQQALTKERAEGRLDEAITLYQRIVRDNAKDRPLVAKTLVQLGHAYERLGRDEARKAYERVIRDFADQRSAVRDARDRMSALSVMQAGGARGEPVSSSRMVLTADALAGSVVTSDGRWLVFVDSTGNLATRDLRDGHVAQVTHEKHDWDEFADYSAASDEGQIFAYAWWNGPLTRWELRTVRRGGVARVLISRDDVGYARPYAFTPDGRYVVAAVSTNSGSALELVNVANGDRQPLVAITGQDPQGVSISPDGKFVVYDAVVDSVARTRDVRILTLANHRDTVLVAHPADDFEPMWTGDGHGVLFVSTRAGSRAGWLVPVADGRPGGGPKLVRPNLGAGSQLGLTRDGALYYTPVNSDARDVFTAEVDLTAGRVVKAPELVVSKTNGSGLAPAWSRDGKFLVYLAGRGAEQVARVRAFGTNTESEVRAPMATAVQMMPDDRSVIVTELDRVRSRWGIQRIDLTTGTTTRIVDREEAIHNVIPSADGRTIYYVLWNFDGKQHSSVVERDVATGAERTLYPKSSARVQLGFMALSPDGHWLAVNEDDRQGNQSGTRIKLIPLTSDGDSVRTLARQATTDGTPSWTPDGRSIITMGNRNGLEIWSVPTDGSVPRKIDINLGKSHIVRAVLHPDGRHLALRVDDYTSELWVAEHFLPAGNTAKK